MIIQDEMELKALWALASAPDEAKAYYALKYKDADTRRAHMTADSAKALASIRKNLDPTYRHVISAAKLPSEALKILDDEFNKVDPQERAKLEDRLTRMVPRDFKTETGHSDVLAYIVNFQALVVRLADAGTKVEKAALLIKLQAALQTEAEFADWSDDLVDTFEGEPIEKCYTAIKKKAGYVVNRRSQAFPDQAFAAVATPAPPPRRQQQQQQQRQDKRPQQARPATSAPAAAATINTSAKPKRGPERPLKPGQYCFVCCSTEHRASSCPDRATATTRAFANLSITDVDNKGSDSDSYPGHPIGLSATSTPFSTPGSLLDSGANRHIAKSAASLTNTRPTDQTIRVASDQAVRSTVVGESGLPTVAGGHLPLKDVLVQQQFPHSLVSVSRFVRDTKGSVVLEEGKAEMRNASGEVLVVAKEENGLYVLPPLQRGNPAVHVLSTNASSAVSASTAAATPAPVSSTTPVAPESRTEAVARAIDVSPLRSPMLTRKEVKAMKRATERRSRQRKDARLREQMAPEIRVPVAGDCAVPESVTPVGSVSLHDVLEAGTIPDGFALLADAKVGDLHALHHARCGHQGPALMKAMGFETREDFHCETCALANARKLPTAKVKLEECRDPFRLHADTAGPLPLSRLGKQNISVCSSTRAQDTWWGGSWVNAANNTNRR